MKEWIDELWSKEGQNSDVVSFDRKRKDFNYRNLGGQLLDQIEDLKRNDFLNDIYNDEPIKRSDVHEVGTPKDIK